MGNEPMMPAVISGAGAGLGLLLLAVALFPPRPTLAASLARLDEAARMPRRTDSSLATGSPLRRALVRHAGQPLAVAFQDRGWLSTGLRSDLAVVGHQPATFFAVKAA